MANLGTRSDESKVILGLPRKGPEVVGNYAHDGLVDPGVAGCLNSSGEFVAGAANPLIGISRGVCMKHVDRNSVTLKGKEVPLKLTDLGEFATGTIEITDFGNLIDSGNDTITVGSVTFVAGAAAAVLGEETFQAASSDEATATSLAAQINAHEDLADLVEAVVDGAEVTVTAKEKGAAGNSIALAYSDEGSETVGATVSDANLDGGANSFDYVVPGAVVYVDDTTGFATANDEGVTASNWKYASDPLEGVSPAAGGSSADCALVNM